MNAVAASVREFGFGRPVVVADGRFANVAWDQGGGRFCWIDLAFIENERPAESEDSPFSWSDALRYDPPLELVPPDKSSARMVWILRYDRKTARMEEMKDE